MPTSGEPEAVNASPNEPLVRVYAAPPKANARPNEIIDGFLQTLTGNDPDYSIARKYLTAEAAKSWNPESLTTVLEEGPKTRALSPVQEQETAVSYGYELSGESVATIDADHAYQPEAKRYNESIQLVKEGGKSGQWRISEPPVGVVLGESDFQRLYESVNKYYFASNMAPAGDDQPQPPPLVADPVYVRGDPEPPLADVVKALLAGPTSWLDPVVSSRFPSGTALRKGTKELSPDDQKRLQVPLNSKANGIKRDLCRKMAAQIYFTLDNLAKPSGIDQVELLRSDGESSLCVLDKAGALALAPDPAGEPDHQYFIDKKHQLVRMPKNQSVVEPVPGGIGSGKQQLRSAAVSRDEKWGAGVSGDGSSLFVGGLYEGAELDKAKVTSKAAKESERLTAPSWDGRGDLWVADQDPKNPRLLWLDKGQGDPVEVEFDRQLGEDGEGRIKAVRVAADGVRIALLVEQDGRTGLRIGRVEHRSNGGTPEIAVTELRAAAPNMEVSAMSWAGGSRLLVVGKEADGVKQMRFVQSDGSLPDVTSLPGLNEVASVAASENQQLALVAHSKDGIVRRAEGEDWKLVVKEGAAPVYPG
ncbi:GerMN domain-containing protein [Streptomyces sp. TRM66268-LWL]|uniref:GerMN domain-containing protein n=2 Tax=Streptomyces polyasparticus TaxID=2767826 RepID=A0ABR7STM4_9ACTN|nr:GerMN domain-containing protein [Streptomyces polyasparticus]